MKICKIWRIIKRISNNIWGYWSKQNEDYSSLKDRKFDDYFVTPLKRCDRNIQLSARDRSTRKLWDKRWSRIYAAWLGIESSIYTAIAAVTIASQILTGLIHIWAPNRCRICCNEVAVVPMIVSSSWVARALHPGLLVLGSMRPSRTFACNRDLHHRSGVRSKAYQDLGWHR